ncbi:Adaptive-response sensory-kinase SasA [Pseudoalteromonas holothuriae]|uniref:histidine kinase n=1 Tax=Pseudoalteromonas holothuriae TaxID=2963714 RepID=A0ABN8UJA3_9GAMM|nr:ATP-binding protein [Pseudoalteromonas sp. CIP111951]CAH9056048.1 Adaptive-response sensory-kinase SasA [Pseudoalteromonas sp. CIP111951]
MWRFVVALIILTLFGSIGLGKLFDTLNEQSQQKKEINQQQVIANQALLAQIALQQLAPNQQHFFLQQTLLQLPEYEFAIHKLADYPLPKPLLLKLKTQPVLVFETNKQLQAYTLLAHDQILLTSTTKEPLDESTNILMTMSFYAALMMLILLFIAPFVMRLRKLSVATTHLGSGYLQQRVSVGSIWYLKELETNFNTMATTIETLVDDIKLLASGLSHELRTPLARVRMGLDTLVETNDEALRLKYEQRVNANLDTMEDLLNQLLSFARLQYTLDNLKKEPVDLNQIVKDQCSNLNDSRLQIHYSNQRAIISADRHYLGMCISNLVSNAFKYCDTQASISILCKTDSIQLIVSDDGKGIKPSEHEKIFKPFVRLDKQHHSGYGVGLAFVARVAAWLDASISVDRCEALGGAKFIIQFKAHNR